MSIEEVTLAIENIRSGLDIVPAIIGAVFKTTSCECPPGSKPLCPRCIAYNLDAPEVQALDEFRTACGTRALGAWSHGDVPASWSMVHDREDAIALLSELTRARGRERPGT